VNNRLGMGVVMGRICTSLVFSALAAVLLGSAAAATDRGSFGKAERGGTFVMPASAAASVDAKRTGLQRCTTNSSPGGTAADVSGAASNTHVVVTTNVTIGVYRRSDCGVASRVPLKTFFAGLGLTASDTLPEPRVIFDFESSRFFVVVFSHNPSNTNQSLYYAVSANSAGSAWHRYRIVLSQGANFFCKTAAASQWVFPSAGANSLRWFVTANNFPASGDPTGAIISIDKESTLTGDDDDFKCFRNQPYNIQAPIVRDANADAYFLSPGRDQGTIVRRRKLQTNVAVIGDTVDVTPNITIPFWKTTGEQYTELTNGCSILIGDGRFSSPTIQIGTFLWNVHSINVQSIQQARWRLYKFSDVGTTPLFVFTPSTFGNVRHHNFNASVAVGSTFGSVPAFVTFTRVVERQSAVPNGQRPAMLIYTGPNSSPSGWSTSSITVSPSQPTCDLFDPFVDWSSFSATQIDPQSHELSPEAWGFNQLSTGASPSNWTTRGIRAN
jgi:hypothetical protein